MKKKQDSFSAVVAVGHEPARQLTPQDEVLFRSFQSNLLSLVSHELKTPLMGVLNALTLLEEQDLGGAFSVPELTVMAKKNALKLQSALASLLDLASLESKNFHVKLREVDLWRLVESKVKTLHSLLHGQELTISLECLLKEGQTLLADPQKLGRALELALSYLLSRVQKKTELKISVAPLEISLEFDLKPNGEQAWDESWMQGLAGFQGGVGSPSSVFSGVLQSEQAFLSRTEEGLGSELLLIHEILKQHQGKFESDRKGNKIKLRLIFPAFSSEQGLRAVLASRVSLISPEQGGVGAVSLGLIKVPEGLSPEELTFKIKKGLFRASDTVYALPEKNQVALILDDCKSQDAPLLLERLEKITGLEFKSGLSSCPQDGVDPEKLMELAEKRLQIAQ